MCNDTKRKIAAAVIDMMRTRPVSKITVQQIMEQTQMKRQSFYYHYQDIYDVLEWIVTTDVCGPLQYDETQPLTVDADAWQSARMDETVCGAPESAAAPKQIVTFYRSC